MQYLIRYNFLDRYTANCFFILNGNDMFVIELGIYMPSYGSYTVRCMCSLK